MKRISQSQLKINDTFTKFTDGLKERHYADFAFLHYDETCVVPDKIMVLDLKVTEKSAINWYHNNVTVWTLVVFDETCMSERLRDIYALFEKFRALFGTYYIDFRRFLSEYGGSETTDVTALKNLITEYFTIDTNHSADEILKDGRLCITGIFVGKTDEINEIVERWKMA